MPGDARTKKARAGSLQRMVRHRHSTTPSSKATNTHNGSNPQPCRGGGPTRKAANGETASPSSRPLETQTIQLQVVIANQEIGKLPGAGNKGTVWRVESAWGKLREESIAERPGQVPRAEWMLLQAVPPRTLGTAPLIPAMNQCEAQKRPPQSVVQDFQNLKRRMALRRAKLLTVATMPNAPGEPPARENQKL